MIEKWRKSLDTRGNEGGLLTDLSKVFGCIDHQLLIAKLHASSFDTDALKSIYSYLRGLRQFLYIFLLLKLFLVYLKDQFLGHYYLTLTYVIFFMILMI